MIEVSSYLEQQQEKGDDSLLVIETGNSVWFCIADGAGGSGFGSLASSQAVEAFKGAIQQEGLNSSDDFETLIRKVDIDINLENMGGETTAIFGKVDGGTVIGASVGDSEAWVYNRDHDYDLTHLQNRKPLVGSGKSVPVGFGPNDFENFILLGSDGLFKYSERDLIRAAIYNGGDAQSVGSLAKSATGKLQDDISIILISKKS